MSWPREQSWAYHRLIEILNRPTETRKTPVMQVIKADEQTMAQWGNLACEVLNDLHYWQHAPQYQDPYFLIYLATTDRNYIQLCLNALKSAHFQVSWLDTGYVRVDLVPADSTGYFTKS